MILLDTNIIAAFLNGNELVSKRILEAVDQIALSALVVAELNYGAKVSSKTKENLERLNRLLEIIRVVPFDIECAKAFGTIKSRLRSISRPTGEMDALIAATAIANNAILVTMNKKHFENIEDLNVEIWPTK
jgi:tRNA(fMet)-specific endonuclease VapC